MGDEDPGNLDRQQDRDDDGERVQLHGPRIDDRLQQMVSSCWYANEEDHEHDLRLHRVDEAAADATTAPNVAPTRRMRSVIATNSATRAGNGAPTILSTAYVETPQMMLSSRLPDRYPVIVFAQSVPTFRIRSACSVEQATGTTTPATTPTTMTDARVKTSKVATLRRPDVTWASTQLTTG
jgi:hypothetical protein